MREQVEDSSPPRGVPIFHPVKCEEMTDGIPFTRICSVPKNSFQHPF